MTVLVTGGAGLIGSHVVDLLADRGDPVRVLDALAAPVHDGKPDWLRPDVHYLWGDIGDPDALRAALDGVTTLVHLAAHGGFEPGAAPYFDTNVTSYARMLDVAEELGAPLTRAVVASSQAVYGEGAAVCDEHGQWHPGPRDIADLRAGRWDVPCPRCGAPGSPTPTPEDHVAPRSPYALSKLCLEQVALVLGRSRGLATTALRFSQTYGRRQSASNPYAGVIPLWSGALVRGEQILVYEDGTQLRDLIHVTDVARAVVHVLDDPRSHGEVYNVCTGVGTANRHVIAALAGLWDTEADLWLPGWARPGDMRHLVGDPSRLKALGWSPKVTLPVGLADYVAWQRHRPWPASTFAEAVAGMRASGVIVEAS